MASKSHAPGSNYFNNQHFCLMIIFSLYFSNSELDPINSQSSIIGPSNTSAFQKKSLNKGQRKKELMKITMENHAILKRL